MYITSDLFGGPNSPRNHCDTPTATSPSTHNRNMANTQHTPALGKRKRRVDSDETTSSHTAPVHPISPRPNKTPSKHHTSTHTISDTSNLSKRPSPPSTTPHITTDTRPTKHLKRTTLGGLKKPSLPKQASHLMDTSPDTPSTPPTTTTISDTDLRACHICHNAPKRKKDLENYLACRTCWERACFICARECTGGCGKQLCSKCCVEVGEEGEAWCLECYQRNVNAS